MNGRGFLYALGAGSAAALAPVAGQAAVPEHNWEGYDFGAGPPVSDGLYQGPFPQYATDAVVPGSDVVMVTTPSTEIVPNYGMGLVVQADKGYAEAGAAKKASNKPAKKTRIRART